MEENNKKFPIKNSHKIYIILGLLFVMFIGVSLTLFIINNTFNGFHNTISKKEIYKNNGIEDLKLNVVYDNLNKSKKPVVILIHGGGFTYGTEDSMLPIAKDFVKNGYVVVIPQYTLVVNISAPQQRKDVEDVYNWIVKNQDKYNFDVDRIGVFGGSFGGMLSLFAVNDNSIKVKTAVALYPPTDFENLINHKNQLNMSLILMSERNLREFTGCEDISSIKTCKALSTESPITYLDKNDGHTLIIHSKIDDRVPYYQSLEYKQYSDQIGGKVDLMIIDNLGHSSQIFFDYEKDIFDYFDKYLKNGRK